MVTITLYIFTFTSWGLGLLSALIALGMEVQKHALRTRSAQIEIDTDALELLGRKGIIERMSGGGVSRPGKGIPEELKKLIEASPGHPEVTEIDENDEVFGIVFKAHAYPPDMEPETESNEE